MPEITADIIRETTVREVNDFMGSIVYKQIDRTYLVSGASTTPMYVSTVSLNLVKGLVPILTPHDIDPLCVARNYSFHPSGSDDGGNVIVSYIYEVQANSVTADAGLVQELSDFEVYFDGGVWKRRPIIVKFYPNKTVVQPDGSLGPTAGDNTGVKYHNGVVPVLRPTMGLSFSQTLGPGAEAYVQYQAILACRRTHLYYANSTTFSGDPTYYWLCDRITGSQSPNNGIATVNVHFTFRIDGWWEWVRYQDDKPHANIWRYDAAGNENPNGYYKSTPYPTVDLNGLVGLLGMAVP